MVSPNSLRTSSLRKQGPIATGLSGDGWYLPTCLKRDHAVWVPAFAGTTDRFGIRN